MPTATVDTTHPVAVTVPPWPEPSRDRSRRRNPIVAAVDSSSSGVAAAKVAARLAREASAPLVLVYVRTGPPGWLGEPNYQQGLDTRMAVANAALERARNVAQCEGVQAETEILEGAPARRIHEFAQARNARMVVVGARRRRLRRSVSRQVIRDAAWPVVVANS